VVPCNICKQPELVRRLDQCDLSTRARGTARSSARLLKNQHSDRMSTAELKRRKSKRLQSKGLQSTDASHTRPNVNSDKAHAGSTKTNGSHDQPRPRQGSILWCCSVALVLLAALVIGTSKLGVLDRQSAVNLPSATSECYAAAFKLL